MIIRSVSLTFSLLLAVAALNAVPVTQNGSAPSLDRPCTFATADEMSALLGTRVTTATDEHFRCKYVVEKGWLETKLLDISLKTTRDIYDYDKAHGKAVPGVGDQAYVLGATLVSKVGDVAQSDRAEDRPAYTLGPLSHSTLAPFPCPFCLFRFPFLVGF